ncbi:type IV pilin protein [Dyella sp. 2HG41-7]|uniref:type IV pilin protein n=1 Tax=Dyella sp. 2HG41-7 TaxID=2883239 RepID=UPI001F25E3A0|nr:type IV pilin protein [Dyella sp. 2HG41-7]
MDRTRGFTLFELIAAVAIAAILAAVATQSYVRYASRSRRTDAHHMLMTIASSEERWYATYNRYTDDPGKLGYATPTLSPHGYYEATVTVTDDDGQAFIATAIPIKQQAGDACGTLSIDNAGHKTPAKSDAAANANGNCW